MRVASLFILFSASFLPPLPVVFSSQQGFKKISNGIKRPFFANMVKNSKLRLYAFPQKPYFSAGTVPPKLKPVRRRCFGFQLPSTLPLLAMMGDGAATVAIVDYEIRKFCTSWRSVGE
jgi:hypothetical protein